MKKFWKYLAAAAVIMSVTPLMSCDNDDDFSSSPGRPDYTVNRVYMLDADSEYGTYGYTITGELLKQLENPLTVSQIRCTRPAPEDVKVVAEIDPTLVAEYNQAKGTNYKLMTGAKLVTTDFTIPRGEFIASDKLVVDFTSLTELEGNTQGLILPIAIKSVTGGLVISKTSRCFIVFDYKANELTPIETYYVNVDDNINNWQSNFTNLVIDNFITAEWALENPVTITATVDKTLASGYKTPDGKVCQEIDATVQPITIAKGQTSVNLSVKIGDYKGIQDGKQYAIPLRLAITSGEGAALTSDVVYVVVRPMPLMMTYVLDAQPTDADPVYPTGWTRIQSQDNWSATMTRDEEETDWSAFVKGDGAGQYIFTGDIMQIDLGTPTKVGGMSLQFYAWYWGMSSINTIRISNDGKEWTIVEGCDFQNDNPHIACIRLNKPSTFRYIKFTFGGYNYPDYGGFLQLVSFWNI